MALSPTSAATAARLDRLQSSPPRLARRLSLSKSPATPATVTAPAPPPPTVPASSPPSVVFPDSPAVHEFLNNLSSLLASPESLQRVMKSGPSPVAPPSFPSLDLEELRAHYELRLADKELEIQQLKRELRKKDAEKAEVSAAPHEHSTSSALIDSLECEIARLEAANRELRSASYNIRTENSQRIMAFIQKQNKFEREIALNSPSSSTPPASSHFRDLSLSTIKMLAGALKTLNQQNSQMQMDYDQLKRRERRFLTGTRVTSEALERLAAAGNSLKKSQRGAQQRQAENDQLRQQLDQLRAEHDELTAHHDSAMTELSGIAEENRILRALADSRTVEIQRKIASRTSASVSRTKPTQLPAELSTILGRLERAVLALDRQRLSESAAVAFGAVEELKKILLKQLNNLMLAEQREVALMEIIQVGDFK